MCCKAYFVTPLRFIFFFKNPHIFFPKQIDLKIMLCSTKALRSYEKVRLLFNKVSVISLNSPLSTLPSQRSQKFYHRKTIYSGLPCKQKISRKSLESIKIILKKDS
jgi:hypothetical protein